MIKSRLGLKLLLGVVGALLLSGGLLFGTRALLYAMIDNGVADTSAADERAFDRIQDYVTQQKLSVSELEKLNAWRDGHKDAVLFFLFSNGHLTYDSTMPNGVVGDGTEDEDSGFDSLSYSFTLTFTDGTLQAAVYSMAPYQIYRYADALSYILGFCLFVILVLYLMRGKLRYIARMRDELHILEGGDLTYRMTVRGGDELAELARGIDDMRLSILERQEGETTAQKANRDLITAMSHDLRTPLTSLMGYLTLLEQERYEDEAQYRHFLLSSQQKAQRIKELSDKLFEYFLVYARDPADAHLEEVDACQFFQQLLEEHVFDLKSVGFSVETCCPGFSASMQTETDTLLRVFENLFGNIKKYGDPAVPVRICCTAGAGMLTFTMENGIRADRSRCMGTRIGLDTFRSVIGRHGGTFRASDGNGAFLVMLTLPIGSQTPSKSE